MRNELSFVPLQFGYYIITASGAVQNFQPPVIAAVDVSCVAGQPSVMQLDDIFQDSAAWLTAPEACRLNVASTTNYNVQVSKVIRHDPATGSIYLPAPRPGSAPEAGAASINLSQIWVKGFRVLNKAANTGTFWIGLVSDSYAVAEIPKGTAWQFDAPVGTVVNPLPWKCKGTLNDSIIVTFWV